MNVKINRNKFLKILTSLLIFPFFYLVNRMIGDHRRYSPKQKEFRIANPPPGLSISGPVIISKTADELNIFSSKCTHLGCSINKIENNEIICPCHGSRYDKNGIPVKGPSIKRLIKLDYDLDQASGEIIVKLSE